MCASAMDGGGTGEVASSAPVVLDVKNLCKVFTRKGAPDVVAVHNVCFQVRAGKCVGLVGESGCGKSTIASIIMRFQNATSGEVLLGETNVLALRGRGIRPMYRQVQMVFQHPESSFDPRCTLGEGIAESLRNYDGLSSADALNRAKELLERCGLPADFAGRYAREVSGGQCQRASIARALALEPQLLVCDEATSALDMTVQKQIVQLLADVRRASGMAMLFICHDIALTQEMCDDVLVMRAGRIVECGSVERVLSSPQHSYTKQLIDAVQ